LLHLAARVLRARCAEGRRFAHARPGFDRRGLAPAKIANGSLCEWNSFEYRSAFVESAPADLSADDGNTRKVGRECRSREQGNQNEAHEHSPDRRLYRGDRRSMM